MREGERGNEIAFALLGFRLFCLNFFVKFIFSVAFQRCLTPFDTSDLRTL